MDGKPWKAGKFAFSLRVSLWAEHLGLCAEEVSDASNFQWHKISSHGFIQYVLKYSN